LYKQRIVGGAKHQAGMSLIELMISIVVGLITIAAAITVYVLVFKGTVLAIRSTQLNYDIDNLMLLMTNDIRRAGFWGGAVLDNNGNAVNVTANPFMQNNTDIFINADRDCIVYSYDLDGDGNFDNDADGLADGDDKAELVGFRFNSASKSISMRLEGTDPDSCDDAGGTWQELTVTSNSEQVEITDFEVSFEPLSPDTSGGDGVGPYQAQTSSSLCDNIDDTGSNADSSVDCSGYSPVPSENDLLAVRRIVNIRVTAQSSKDSDIYKSLTASVKLGNDALKLAPAP